jgi:hypothetical protein
MTLEYSCFASPFTHINKKKNQDFFTLKIFRKFSIGWYKGKRGKEF